MRRIIIISLLLAPLLALAQENPGKKKAYYFFGEQCPHCKKVDEYFQANGIYEKYEITKLEVVGNPFNGKLFLQFGKSFGVDDWGGVPTVVFGDKYLVGDTPIIENFVREIDAAENANELPDPEKIGDTGGGDNQGEQLAANNAGEKKKNYFPAGMAALVVIVGGALVYINRKK